MLCQTYFLSREDLATNPTLWPLTSQTMNYSPPVSTNTSQHRFPTTFASLGSRKRFCHG
jgi:hypothetical protein